MRISRILVPAALVVASSMAFAHPGDTNDTLSFSKLDKDQNGQLTKAELPSTSMYSKHFAKIDTDGNGTLSKTEVDEHLVAMGMSPEKMDHGDMKGMHHDDATKSDDTDMDDGDY